MLSPCGPGNVESIERGKRVQRQVVSGGGLEPSLYAPPIKSSMDSGLRGLFVSRFQAAMVWRRIFGLLLHAVQNDRSAVGGVVAARPGILLCECWSVLRGAGCASV